MEHGLIDKIMKAVDMMIRIRIDIVFIRDNMGRKKDKDAIEFRF